VYCYEENEDSYYIQSIHLVDKLTEEPNIISILNNNINFFFYLFSFTLNSMFADVRNHQIACIVGLIYIYIYRHTHHYKVMQYSSSIGSLEVQIIRVMVRYMVLALCILVLLNIIASVPSSSAARLLENNNVTKVSTKIKSYMLQNGLGQTPPMGYAIPSLSIFVILIHCSFKFK
jgi:hypothetical protein